MAKMITNDGKRGFFILALSEDGAFNLDAMSEDLAKQAAEVEAEQQTDFETVAAEVNAYLLDNPGLRSVPTETLKRSLWERRIESGSLKGVSPEERTALYDRMSDVVPNYIRSATDRFYIGKKSGILVRFVEGETVKNEDGSPKLVNGKPAQALRHTDEEWTAKTTPKKAA